MTFDRMAKAKSAGVIIQKYGGSSVGNVARVRRVCRRIAAATRSGRQVVAVVAAMGHTTDRLIDLAYRISAEPSRRELDMLVANGETIAAPLVAMGLQGMGVPAVSLSALQAGIWTNASYSEANITEVRPTRVLRALAQGKVAVVAGFQGVTEDFEVTTLGRGGSDTTAVALAATLSADVCEIYGSADGILTADRRVVPAARLLRYISYEETLELAAMGFNVMQPRAVEIGELYGVPIHVRSTLHRRPGTLIVQEVPAGDGRPVCAVAHATHLAKVRVVVASKRPDAAASILEPLGEHEISVDVIGQVGATDLTFMVHDSALGKVLEVVEPVARSIGGVVSHEVGLAKLSIVGSGMPSTPGVAARMFRTLAEAGVNIEMITTSEIRITCIVKTAEAERAVRALHTTFELDGVRKGKAG